MGPEAVDAAAREVVRRNPPQGTLRSAQVFVAESLDGDELEPSYLDTLGTTLAASPDAMLYRVCASDETRSTRHEPPSIGCRADDRRDRPAMSAPGSPSPTRLSSTCSSATTRCCWPCPTGAASPHLRAGIVVDDPDFVAALRNWFDETVWDPKCWYADLRGNTVDEAFAAIGEVLSGAEQHLDPAAPLFVGPGSAGKQPVVTG